MSTKLLMTSSAIFLGVLGLITSFLPQEILLFLNTEETLSSVLFLQILGAQYLGFAMLNWMGKGNMLGGIYYRPVTIGNFMHFGVGALTIIRLATSTEYTMIWFLAVPYLVFAALFGKVFITNPKKVGVHS